MSKIKYTKEILEPIVKESISVAEVIRKLGLREAGGTHCHVTRKIEQFNIDKSHFLGQRANLGKKIGAIKKLKWQWKTVERDKRTK